VRLNAEIRLIHKLEKKNWKNSKQLAKFFKKEGQILWTENTNLF